MQKPHPPLQVDQTYPLRQVDNGTDRSTDIQKLKKLLLFTCFAEREVVLGVVGAQHGVGVS